MKKLLLFISSSAFLFYSCTAENLEPTLATIKDAEGSITSADDLAGLVRGALDQLTTTVYYGRSFIVSDEIRGITTWANGNSGRFTTQATYGYVASTGLGIWATAYRMISRTNLILSQDEANLDGEPSEISHYKGQAHFLRALGHFDLLRSYGQQHLGGTLGVPIITEFKGDNVSPARNTVTEVKDAIYADLDRAFNLIQDGGSDKQFPIKLATKALESRVALYFGEWSRAASAAKAVIDSGQFQILAPGDYVNSYTADNSANSIFEIAFNDTDNRGINGLAYIYRGDSYGDVEVLPTVLDLYEEGDVRNGILGYEGDKLRNMNKWPDNNGGDNVGIIRFEEIVLNYAEALFEQGQVDAAVSELNKITSNRGASAYTAPITKDDILRERTKELIFEGFQFFDYQRTRRTIPVVHSFQNNKTPISPTDHRRIYPIPQYEINANSNIVQNDNY